MGHCDKEAIEVDQKIYDLPNKILLMGNPNVGKSVIFTALTGVHVMSSNYAGTTVTYTKAKLNIENEEYNLIDVPGTYSLSASSEAEQVAVSFMESGAKAIICVLDMTNLTRNLNLALEIKQYNIPVVFALNLLDVATRKGISIDNQILEEELNSPVVSTVAVKGEGLDDVINSLKKVLTHKGEAEHSKKVDIANKTQKEVWDISESIVQKCQSKINSDLKFIDRLGQNMVKPMPGIPIAILIMLVALGMIVGGGKAL